jgi:cyanophycinase
MVSSPAQPKVAVLPVIVLLFMGALSCLPVAIAADPAGHRGALVLIGGGLKPSNHAVFATVHELLAATSPRVSRGTGPAPMRQAKESVAAPGLDYLGDLSERAVDRRTIPPRLGYIGSGKRTLADSWEPYAHDDPDQPDEYPSYERWFRQEGFDPVFIPLALDVLGPPSLAAHDRKVVSLIESCQVLFLTGGDQSRHARTFLEPDGRPTPVLQALQRVLARGGVIMGSSAGSHVQADPQFGWGQSYETLLANRLAIGRLADVGSSGIPAPPRDNSLRLPGLGLAPAGWLIDTHFDARGRLGRLLVGMRDTGAGVGIGLDENTALVVRGTEAWVVGEHGVTIVQRPPRSDDFRVGPQTHEMNVPTDERRAGPPRFVATDWTLHYLRAGDSVDTVLWRFHSPRAPLVPGSAKPRPSRDIFSAELDADGGRRFPYETTRVVREFADSSVPAVLSSTYERGPAFLIRVRKVPITRAFKGLGSADVSVFDLRFDLQADDRWPTRVPSSVPRLTEP